MLEANLLEEEEMVDWKNENVETAIIEKLFVVKSYT